MKQEISQSGTTHHVCTICLPNIAARDKISQAFPLRIRILKVINIGGANGLGMRLAIGPPTTFTKPD